MTRTFLVSGDKPAKISSLLKKLENKGWAAAPNSTPSPLDGVLWFGHSNSEIGDDFNLSKGSTLILIVSMQNADKDTQSFSHEVLLSTTKLQAHKMALKLAPDHRFNAIIYSGDPETILDGVAYLLDAKAVTGQMMYLDGDL